MNPPLPPFHAKWNGPEARIDAYNNVSQVREALTHLLFEILPIPDATLHVAALALDEAIDALTRTENALDRAIQEAK